MKISIGLAALMTATNLATAQEVPAPRHVSEQILATNKPNAEGSNCSWPMLAGNNIEWRKREWRDIDVNDKANWVFRQEKVDNSLLNTLVAGVMNGKIKAYRDDRFSEELSTEELAMRVKMIGNKEPTPDGSDRIIPRYQLKEDSIGLRSEARAEVRILGIAPMVEQPGANGGTVELAMFWIYYIDALNYLAQSPVPNRPGFTWADILESRSFSGSVVRENLKMFH